MVERRTVVEVEDDGDGDGQVGAGLAGGKAQPLGPGDPQVLPASMGATFAERKAAREKAVESGAAENKSVKSAARKG